MSEPKFIWDLSPQEQRQYHHRAATQPALLRAAVCQSAIDDLPMKQGEIVLRENGWDGEEDIERFISNIRRAAIAAAEPENPAEKQP